mgnify:CR=1 FL=1
MNNILSLQIIFNLKNRKKYLIRYFKVLKEYKPTFDILVISEKDQTLIPDIYSSFKNNVLIFNINKKISGMNDIFKSINKANNIIKKYKYVNFIEDDNFIFPDAIKECEKFLNRANNKFIACNGINFLFKYDLRYNFLNIYHSPNFFKNTTIERALSYKNNGGLLYYSLFRTKIFLKICSKINYIHDDNLSEILFNYTSLFFGNIKKLNIIYLAREYPRPRIYNIPNANEWIQSNRLMYEINKVYEIINNQIKNDKYNYDTKYFFELTILHYLKLRFQKHNNKNYFNNFFIILKKYFFVNFIKKNKKVELFFNRINNTL